jgi:tetratricopeptide (TPR) repeat protein
VKREDRDFLELLGYLYLQYGKMDEARIVYAVLLRLTSTSPMRVLTYSYCLAQTGRYALALHHLDDIAGSTFSLKERSAYLLLRGNVLWNLGKDEGAREVFQKFLEVERKRAQRQPERLSLIARAELSRQIPPPSPVQTQPVPAAAPTAVKKNREIAGQPIRGNDGIWKKILRFIARKELNRELSRPD